MILSVMIGFLAFFLLHALTLRLLPRPRTVNRVLFTLVGSFVGGVAVTWLLARDAISLALLTLVAIWYVFGVFVIVDSSIHVRILLFIAEPENGLTKKELLAGYNRRIIVRRRLDRLVAAGELHHRRGTYRLAKSTSLLLARERLSRIMKCLFP